MRLCLLPLAAVVLAAAAPAEVLRSSGYGLIIADGKLFHESGRNCWPDPAGADALAPYARTVPRIDGRVGRTAMKDGETVYPFERISRLPARCRTPDTSDRAAVLAIADLMLRHYPGAEVRGLDLRRRRSELSRRLGVVHTPVDAWAAANAFLDGITDPHLELSATIDGEDMERTSSEGKTLDTVRARGGERPERAWLRAWREGVERHILGGRGKVAANNRLLWGRRGDVGYLAILTMGGFDPEDGETIEPLDMALDMALRDFAGARAVVVDVSNNRGGYDSVSARIAGRFAAAPVVAMTKEPYATKAAPQAIAVIPSPRPSFHGQVYVLTSDITVSAGETFTQMMRMLPNAVQVGSTTRGAFSDQAEVPLPNGWRFAMPMEVYRAPGGRLMEGRGLEPQLKLDLYPVDDLDHGHARAVVGFIDRLNGSDATRP